MKTATAICCGLWAVTLFASPEFDRGGVTFPMEKISAERFKPAQPSAANLLVNADLSQPLLGTYGQTGRGWDTSTWIFGEANRKKFDTDSRMFTSAKIVTAEDGRKALQLNRPISLEKLMGDLSDKFTISFSQLVKLPDEKGGSYRLTLDCRNQLIGKNRFDQMVLLWFRDGSDPRPGRGKETREYIYSKLLSAPEWHPHSLEFTVPPGTRDLNVTFRADGCGKVQIRNPQLVRLENRNQIPVTVELSPFKLLDNTFALAPGLPGVMGFKFRNNLPKGTLKYGKIRMNLELPAEISVDGANCFFGKEVSRTEFSADGKKWTRRQFSLDGIIPYIRNSTDFNGWNIPDVMISGNAAPGTVWNNCRYYLTEDGKILGTPETFTLKMLPAFRKSTAPKQFFTGFSSVYNDLTFQQPELNKRIAEFVGRTGTTLMLMDADAEYSAMLRANGVRLIGAETYAIANGYRIGVPDAAQRPAYANYLDKNGKPVISGSHSLTCPAAIYNRTPYYNTFVLPILKKKLATLDGIVPNWEPYATINKGCFCNNCRDEFAEFAGISADKIKDIWPARVQPGFEYRDQVIRFRAKQHAKLIKTLHEDCLKTGSGKIGFCPEVGTDQIIVYPNHFYEQWEFTPYEYAGSLKWLNVWGPYVWFLADQPYAYTKGANLLTWEMARRVIRDYRKAFRNPAKRAKLMAMPHGSQCDGTALGQPESLVMDQLSSFLAGYDASVLYFFPRGYDHRYWQAFADCNTLIAANEDMVMNGKPLSGVSAVPQSPFPAPAENIEPKFLPDVKKSDLLQIAAFEKDGRILAAVGNFWEKGDVVFKLSVPGLNPAKKYSVREKAFDRQFIKTAGQSFTGKDLADGILLHAGAMRWVFFEIEPETKSSAKAVTAADMLRELERCRKDNQSAAEAEAARDKALHAENDIGELKSQSSGAFSCKPVEKNGMTMLEISSGKNSALLNPRGMSLELWSLDGQKPMASRFGMSAFWSPGRNGMVADANYRVTGQKISANGLSVTAEFTTNVRNYPQLAGLKIVKTVRFSPDLKKIEFSVELNNTQSVAMNEVGYRWFLQPQALDGHPGNGIECGGSFLKRPGTFMLLKTNCDPASEKIIRRLFNVKNDSVKVSGNEFRFAVKNGPALRGSFSPAQAFGGVAVWDTAGMTRATFEPFYQPVIIPPGGKRAFSAVFSAE